MVNYKLKNKIYLNHRKNLEIMHKKALFESIIVTVIASLILIAMGIIYFIITLWVIKFSSSLMGYNPDGNWAVLSTAVIVAGIMIGSAIKNV